MVILSVMNSFDVLSTTSNSNSTSNSSPPIWMVFLGGEFTFSCMFQIGYHMIQACIEGGRSLSTFVVLSIMTGVALGQVIAGQMLIVDGVHLSAAFLLVTVYIISDSRGGESNGNKPSVSTKTAFYSPVRILVKVGSVLLIITGVLVLGMGLTVKRPSDIVPQLLWNGFGYEYNLLRTFGEESVQSNEFFTMLLCTMLGTICQTLCVGVWIWRSSIGSISCQQGLGFACSGVPLIILSNSISASHYKQMQFKDGQKCMIAHILLLLQTNCHLPVIWFIHELWIGTALENSNDIATTGRKQKIK